MAGCGGGSGGGSPTAPADVTFSERSPRTAFGTGAIAFTLRAPLGTGQQVVCGLNGSPAQPCLTGADSGRIEYAGLPMGPHRLTVEVRNEGGTRAAFADKIVEVVEPTVVVFGGTPGGIAAALAASRAGQRVAIIEPTSWVGGMMSGGLTKTDVGPRGAEVLGGIAASFFARTRAAAMAKGVCPSAGCANLYDFEAREAERVFESMLADAGVTVERLTRLSSVAKENGAIVSVGTSRGDLAAKVFIDASYEGDLMALAGVSYTVGREPQLIADPPNDPGQLAVQEDRAGVLRYRAPRGLYVDPYRIPGDATSGTLPYVEPRPSPILAEGSGDTRVMAYTFRLCVTDDPGNRVAFTAPPGYDPMRYEAVARVALAWAESGADIVAGTFNPAPTVRSANAAYYKYDLNGGSTFSSDMTAPHLNQAYVEADETTRERIRGEYENYIRGLLYFWQTEPRFAALNQKVARFGWCADEFTGRGGWPRQLYVRNARRMLGEYVMNENDVMQNGRRPRVPDVIGFGAYNIDVHTVRYMAAPLTWPDGVRRDSLVIEGFLIANAPNDTPYPVPYRALVPRASEVSNLLNPVTLSATHIAYAALRMEPTFMILGEAAGTAAALAIETQRSVQTVDYGVLRQRLLANGQRLTN